MLSSKLNSFIEIPFKECIFYKMSELDNIGENDQVFFIFHHNQHWLLKYKNGKYIEYLRKKYPNCKIALYLRDLISAARKLDIEFYKNRCDYVFTYDIAEAEEYNLLLCDTFYSKFDVSNKKINYDVYFCGQAKNRLDTIIKSYDYLEGNGYKCLFYITNVPRKKQILRKGIVYNKQISYMQNLVFVSQSRAILEIVQDKGTGTTLRVQEALEYNKYLISNNSLLKKRDFYNKKQFLIFSESLDELDLNTLRRDCPMDNGYRRFSFKGWLDELQ